MESTKSTSWWAGKEFIPLAASPLPGATPALGLLSCEENLFSLIVTGTIPGVVEGGRMQMSVVGPQYWVEYASLSPNMTCTPSTSTKSENGEKERKKKK